MTEPPARAACWECAAMLFYDPRHPRGHPQKCPFCWNPDLIYGHERCDECEGNGWTYREA